MSEVSLRKIVKNYDGGVQAVKGIDLEIADQEFVVLVGPSGCGKSTTLRMIAGLEEITAGEIWIGGDIVNDVPPRDRDIAMVFQNYALYPHMSVFDNMAFGLKLRKFPKDEIKRRVAEAARILDIQALLSRKPRALSGGQRQRVAMGRAIVRNPKVFLFDEPLSNLDAKMRVQMRSEISRLHGELGTTMIYVTHDQVEAMTMGDRICVMRDGVIMQVADPLTLYLNPDNMFVASFIGSPPMNLLQGKVQKREDGLYFVENGEKDALAAPLKGAVEPLASNYVDKNVVFGIRPENITESPKAGGSIAVTSTVDVAEPMGSESIVYLKTGGGYLIARIQGEHLYQLGQKLTVHLAADKVTLFDPETQKVIR
jgi:multiple sugar transport system ATP-binding protein